MLPNQSRLVKCPHCGSLIWIDEQTKIGETEPWGSDAEERDRFPDARSASTPTPQEYATFLKKSVCDKQKERYVRLRIWWAGNDSRRKSDQTTPLDSFEVENLHAFVTLLDDSDDNDRLMKAEALRELGQFEDAEKLLSTTFEDGLTQAVAIIRDLNQKGISAVSRMRFK